MDSRIAVWSSHMRAGLSIGALGSMMSAMLVCGIMGYANTNGLTAIDPDELSLGFAEYSMMGMIYFGVPVCGILGGLAGIVSGWFGGASHSAIVGAITALTTVPIALIAECILFGNPVEALWSQGPLVWATSSLVGAVIAGVYCSFTDPARSPSVRTGNPLVEDGDTPTHLH